MTFWKEQCPARGIALNHKHLKRCEEHFADQCCECGMRKSDVIPEDIVKLREVLTDHEVSNLLDVANRVAKGELQP